MGKFKSVNGWPTAFLQQHTNSTRWTVFVCCAMLSLSLVWLSQPCRAPERAVLIASTAVPSISAGTARVAAISATQPYSNLRPQGIPAMLATTMSNTTGGVSLEQILQQAVTPYRPTVLKTKTQPPFWLAVYRYPEGAKAQGPDGTWEALAASILTHGIWETEETNLFYQALSGRCDNGRGLVVDIGGNVGYFTLLSAMMGCRVHVWEGSPQHSSMIYMSTWMNGMGERVTIHNNICGTGGAPLRYATGGMEGHVAGAYLNSDNPNFKKHIGNEGYAAKAEKDMKEGWLVYPLAIDDVIQEEVLLLKVDVEGYEPHVFKSAQKLLKKGLVRYVVFEYNMWRSMTKAEGVQLVMDFIGWGYSMYTVPFGKCKSEHITTRQRMEDLSSQLQNNTYECAQFDTYLMAVRKDMPLLYEV